MASHFINPDALSLSLTQSIGLGYGVTRSLGIGWMPKNGKFFATYDWSHGLVTYPSSSIDFKSSVYLGKEPMSIESYAGKGMSVSMSVRWLELGYSISDDRNWQGLSVGCSGTPKLPRVPCGASWTHSYTNIIEW